MPTNFYMIFVAALIPMIIGSIYYNPKVLGTVWMKMNGFTEEYLREANMAVIFIVSFIMSFFIAFILSGLVIHQTSIASLLIASANPDPADVAYFNEIMARIGDRYRTFGHGALHGGIVSVLFVMPILAVVSLFERRGWKYILLHSGYWFICLTLMGGLLCATLKY